MWTYRGLFVYWVQYVVYNFVLIQVLGETECFGDQIQKLKDFEFNRELESQLGKYAPKSKADPPDFTRLAESSLLNQGKILSKISFHISVP